MQSHVQLSATSNARLIAYAATAGAAAVVPSLSQAAVITVTPASPISITNSIDGIYFNVLTGATGASGAAVPGWDINPYNNGAGLTLYGAASPSGVLATGTAGTTAVAAPQAVGNIVGPVPTTVGGFYNQFQTVGTAFVTPPGIKYLGFRFQNEVTAAQNYGYLVLNVGATLGFPASIVSYSYENAGAAITVSAVPEPVSIATLGTFALGAVGIRRRRANA